MLAIARTFSLLGVEAREVRVEADVRAGLPAFALVGLPDAAVRESRERVRAALANSGFEFPQQRITANLAPADLRKAGPGSTSRSPRRSSPRPASCRAAALADVALAGELALDGSIRAVPGALAMAEAARRAGARAIVVAAASAAEAALVDGVAVIPIRAARAAQRARRRGGARGAPVSAAVRQRRGPGPRRPARSAGAAPGARGRGGRRAQPADQRAARRRQVDGGAPAALDPAAARAGGGDRGGPGGERVRAPGRAGARRARARFAPRTTRSRPRV